MIIHKSIVHVLDKNSDSPILNDYESKNSLEVDKFFQKIINRVSKDLSTLYLLFFGKTYLLLNYFCFHSHLILDYHYFYLVHVLWIYV